MAPSSSASKSWAPEMLRTTRVLLKGKVVARDLYVTVPSGIGARKEPPLTRATSVCSVARTASATKSPKFVSPQRTRRTPSMSVSNVTSIRPTGWPRVSSTFCSSSSTMALTAGSGGGSSRTSSEVRVPSSWMTIFPTVASFVPVWATITSSPFLFLSTREYCSWEWPSMMALMPVVWDATAPLDQAEMAPLVPKCPTKMTNCAPSARASSTAACMWA